MKTLDEMSYMDAIALYNEKHKALKEGNFEKLVEISAGCPELFDPERDRQMYEMIEYAMAFQNSDRYRKLVREDMKKKLTIVTGKN